MDELQRKKILQNTFNTVSYGYDGKPLRFFRDSAAQFAALLDLKGTEHVLDVATGTGHAAMAIAGLLPAGHVTGVDFSAGMLEQARSKQAALGFRNCDFIERDMQALGFTEEFDLATCAFGIFFVDDMERQLAHIAATVKPGGRVAICNFHENYFEPLRSKLVKKFDDYKVDMPPQVWKQIAHEDGCRNLFAGAGLRDARVEYKNLGYYLDDAAEWWNVIWNAGWRRMLGQLGPSQLEQFRREHLLEAGEYMTDKGIWIDIGVLYTVGMKSRP